MMKATVALTLLTLMVCSSWAASSEGPLPAPLCSLPSPGPVKNILFTGEPHCEFAEALAQTLAQVSQTFQKFPPVTLVIGDRARNASFDTGHIIRIPHRLVFADKDGNDVPASPRQLETVVVHEYGHAILKEIWKKEFARTFGAMFKELEELSDTAEQNLANKISSRSMRNKSQQIAGQRAYQLYYVTLPAYSELYADALAVFFFNDPSVMFQALDFPNIPDTMAPYVILRDFAKSHEVEELIIAKDEHTKLSLVRSYLGRNYISLTNDQKRLQLDKLEKAITRSIQMDLASHQALSIADLNQRLIQFLQEPLKKRLKKSEN